MSLSLQGDLLWVLGAGGILGVLAVSPTAFFLCEALQFVPGGFI